MDASLAGESRPQLSRAIVAAAGAMILAWILAFAFAAPLRSGPIDRAAGERAVEQRLDPAELHRAERFRAGQRRLAALSIGLELALLALLAFWRPPAIRRFLRRLGRRPVAGAATVGAALVLLLAVAELPLGLIALERARDAGLANQAIVGWLRDLALSTGISMLVAAVGAAIGLLIWRRLRGRFWLGASALAIAGAVIVVWLWPTVVSPLFNRFEPLAPGPARTEVLRLSERAGVTVGQVLEVDASRRSNALNAYVDGIGATRRVVIYDNAIRDLDRAELGSLVAHELTHVSAHDLRRGLVYAILVIPLTALAVQLATRLAIERSGDAPGRPGMVPALALSLALAVLLVSVPGNWLSRRVEANADAGSIALAGSRGLVGLQLQLARKNLADPDPPGAWQFLFGTHPSTVERIGMAEAASGGER